MTDTPETPEANTPNTTPTVPLATPEEPTALDDFKAAPETAFVKAHVETLLQSLSFNDANAVHLMAIFRGLSGLGLA